MNDQAFWKELITQQSYLLSQAPNELLNNDDFMAELIKSNPDCIRYASVRLKNNAKFMLKAIFVHSGLEFKLGSELRGNKDYMRIIKNMRKLKEMIQVML